MADVIKFVRNYGNISFTEKPFTKEDNVALAMSFYMPFDKVISPSFDDEPVPFAEACQKLYDYRGGHKPVGLVLVKKISVLMMEMAKQKRYSEMKVLACTETFENKPAVQFNAATYLLPTGEVVVLFRGTDDTLTGWKEDVDMLCSDNGIPSEPLCLEYLKTVAEKFDGDIYVCGHSKGAYVAHYAVMNSPKEIRDRVKAFYNNDGPGMASEDFLDSDVYKELLPRYTHIIPKSSLIGMMMMHDSDYIIVDSKRISGPMQHDSLSWKFDGDKLKLCDDLTKLGKISDLTFAKLIPRLTPEQIAATERAVAAVLEGIGQRGLLDVKKHAISSLKGGKRAYKALDAQTKQVLKETMKVMKSSFKEAKREVKRGEYKNAAERHACK